MLNFFHEKMDEMKFTGDLKKDVFRFLVSNNCPRTAEHCMKVGEEAGRIARLFGADPEQAEAAGYLHDISAVYPAAERIGVSVRLGIEVLPEEEAYPMIIHQKISKVMAEHIFQIKQPAVLNAVGCHTTLRAKSTLLDRVLFVADKIEWDQQGKPPYLPELMEKLELSLEHAAFEYINYLWQRKETLKVVHPWLEEAYWELREQLMTEEKGTA